MITLMDRTYSGWVTVVINDRYISAKIYDTPSTFWINNGRISKMSVSKKGRYVKEDNFFDQMDYNYDRGLDFNKMPDNELNNIINELESKKEFIGGDY